MKPAEQDEGTSFREIMIRTAASKIAGLRSMQGGPPARSIAFESIHKEAASAVAETLFEATSSSHAQESMECAAQKLCDNSKNFFKALVPVMSEVCGVSFKNADLLHAYCVEIAKALKRKIDTARQMKAREARHSLLEEANRVLREKDVFGAQAFIAAVHAVTEQRGGQLQQDVGAAFGKSDGAVQKHAWEFLRNIPQEKQESVIAQMKKAAQQLDEIVVAPNRRVVRTMEELQNVLHSDAWKNKRLIIRTNNEEVREALRNALREKTGLQVKRSGSASQKAHVIRERRSSTRELVEEGGEPLNEPATTVSHPTEPAELPFSAVREVVAHTPVPTLLARPAATPDQSQDPLAEMSPPATNESDEAKGGAEENTDFSTNGTPHAISQPTKDLPPPPSASSGSSWKFRSWNWVRKLTGKNS